MKHHFLIYFFLLILGACNTPGTSVKVTSGGITTDALYALDGNNVDGKLVDLGEYLLTSDPRVLTISVYNSTAKSYTELDLKITTEADKAPSITFAPTSDGAINYPGQGGTCGKELGANSGCLIKLLLTPREGRRYLETLTLSFKNFIEVETHTAQVKFIAGTAASLVFTNDKTQYTFGALVGSAQTPVVERAEKPTFNEELEIVNAGGLPAKDIVVTLAEVCLSAISNDCPTGMIGAYSFENNCPAVLEPGDKCKVMIRYTPKNQDIAGDPLRSEIAEINYRATLNLAFKKDPMNSSGGLNGYFRSVSTTIEARFKVSQATVSFEAPVISGNRDVRTMRISNVGYQEGEIKAIAVRDSGGVLMGTCSARAGFDYLVCVDPSNTPLSLASFPFTIKDKDSCVAVSPLVGKLVPVGSGCLIDVTFQPSVTYIRDYDTDFLNLQPEVIFDSRWQGTTKIVTTKLFNLSAKARAAARISVTSVLLDGTKYPITAGVNPTADLGRLALQSPLYFKRAPFVVTFTNNGSISATNISLRDGLNRTIPIGGAGANLGAMAPFYFSGAVASDSFCTVIPPAGSCTIVTNFAPIGMATGAQEDANMFDGIGLDLRPYKSFELLYDSGAAYTDINRDNNIPDYPRSSANVRVNTLLARKGLLMRLSDDTRNVNSFGGTINAVGGTFISNIFLTNIGTGTIPYIRLQNPPVPTAPSFHFNTNLIPTTNPASLGADYDCLSITDQDFTYATPAGADPSVRAGMFAGLPKDKSCVYTIEMKTADRFRFVNPTSCTSLLPTDSNEEEATRLFSRSLDSSGGTSLWEFCSNNAVAILWSNIGVTYYDGDNEDLLARPFGRRFNLPNYTHSVNQRDVAKLSLHSFFPPLTSTMYRPGFTYPAISGTQVARIIPEMWFYGLGKNFNYLANDPLQVSPFVRGNGSRNFVPTLSGFADRANYDFILYVGSFPQGSPAFDLPIGLGNFGEHPAKVLSYTNTPDPSFTVLTSPETFPVTVPSNSNLLPLTYRFNPSIAGEHRMEIDLSYENGRHLVPLIYKSSNVPSNLATATKEVMDLKILVLAHVQQAGTHPLLTMNVSDYDVIQNESGPPTVTLGDAYPSSLTWNSSPPTSNLIFDTIKLTAAPTVNDAYAKKKIVFSNNTAFPLLDLRNIFRVDASASASRTVPSSFTSSLAQVPMGETPCTSGMTLNPFSSCTLILIYQPTAADSTESFVLTSIYNMGSIGGQYVMQNVGVNLLPRSPGFVVASGRTLETINYNVSQGSTTVPRSSYAMNFGTVSMSTMPLKFNFQEPTGLYQRLILRNTQATKASLLLAYQKNVTRYSLRGYSPGSPAPTSLIPSAGEYRNYGGLDYAVIYSTKYGNGDKKVTMEASKGCFFGDDETNNAIPAHQKGFSSTTITPCNVLTYFSANFDFLHRTLSISNGNDMRETAAELWYFSVNRSSTSSLWVHMKGVITPDPSIASGSVGSVAALDNRTVNFSTQKMTPTNSDLGDIVGLRIMFSNSAVGLNNPYSTAITSYVDIRPYVATSTQFANITTGLANGQYFYFRIVAIRRDTRFVDGTPKRFLGMNLNEYLSAANNNATPVSILVPPINFHYFHTQKLLVEKSLTGGIAYDPFMTSSNRCSLRTQLTLKNPGNINRPFQLINSAAWSLLLSTPSANSYANMTQIPHWMGDAATNIDLLFGSMPGFIPGTSSQILPGSSAFYIRDSAIPNANVRIARGGVPGTTYANYTSLIHSTIIYGSARCMVLLP